MSIKSSFGAPCLCLTANPPRTGEHHNIFDISTPINIGQLIFKMATILIAAIVCKALCFGSTAPTHSATTTANTGRRDLEEVGEGKENHVVMGTGIDLNTNETSTFFATNVTKAKMFDLGLTKSEECSDEARKNAMIVKVSEERRIDTSTPGARGWHMQRVTQIEDDETPALNDFITGADSNYTLVAFFYDLQEGLVECAPLKQHDEDTAAMYNALFNEAAEGVEAAAADNADAAAAGVDVAANDTSSGSKNGLVAAVSAFAAVGIAVVLGDALAL